MKNFGLTQQNRTIVVFGGGMYWRNGKGQGQTSSVCWGEEVDRVEVARVSSHGREVLRCMKK